MAALLWEELHARSNLSLANLVGMQPSTQQCVERHLGQNEKQRISPACSRACSNVRNATWGRMKSRGESLPDSIHSTHDDRWFGRGGEVGEAWDLCSTLVGGDQRLECPTGKGMRQLLTRVSAKGIYMLLRGATTYGPAACMGRGGHWMLTLQNSAWLIISVFSKHKLNLQILIQLADNAQLKCKQTRN